MNLKCLICSDLFIPASEIYVTTCGHLFHYTCLVQWIERSRTCPQCRNKSTEKTIHRVYVSVEEETEATDFATLQNKLDNLQFQINLKDKDIKNAAEKYKVAKAQNVGLREEIRDQENRVKVLESAMHALKEQVAFFKSKAKESERVEEELVKVRDKLRDMEHVQLVITGSREQVNDMLRHNRDPQSLTVLVSTLKKELIDSDRKKKQIQSILKEVQNESQNYRRELSQLSKQNLKLQQDIEAHKHCDAERQYLKKKISELQVKWLQPETGSPIIVDTSVRRIIEESPAPLLNELSRLPGKTATSKDASPSVLEKVQAIKDSQSPYLRVQSSSVGLSGLMNYNGKYMQQSSSGRNNFSIFKQPPVNTVTSKMPSEQMSYDGMGGYCKDEQFPSPKKRTKSASLSAAKYRKLAPGHQKKLNDFFPDTQSD